MKLNTTTGSLEEEPCTEAAQCRQGYRGRMCDSTEKGWYKGFNFGKATRCHHPVWLFLMCVAIIIGWGALNVYLVTKFDSVDIFLNGLQGMAIVFGFRFL